ncbi:hypothetical protein BWZ22_11125 [Seonamhaeicola sp. S2-3]|uniref:hypothetical protein n=1 Tax=Seonamhaeicola sp. S2-3 TaxID=1936081 RepID=UPI000972711D|nr:hypothetical protein [Seonamhaeicola sp. S2-3]APY11753.1 hypothetical protein BWZ22_11125 [Seonamhaeicola sp. S2-3]
MKTYSPLLILLLFSALFLSCSTEQVDEYNNVIGVWENLEVSNSTNTTTHSLTFASNKTVKSILKVEELSGAITSNASIYNWSVDGNLITVSDGETQWVYAITANSQLVLNDEQQNLLYNKISDVVDNY